MTIPTMPQVLTVALEGDSIPGQNTTSTTVFNAIGFLNSVNALSGNRFPYAISQNFATGGGTLASVNSEKVTQLGTATGEMLFLLVGTNDWAASTAIGTMQSNLTAIKDYWVTTLQKRICIIGLLPRTQNGGTPMGSTLIGVARTYNAWLVAQRDVANGVHVVDAYDALCTTSTDEPNPTYFKDESGKLLHPNTAGSLVLGQAIWTQLKVDGFSGKDAPPVGGSNLFTFGAMSGSGGTATSPATGTVATGLTVTGSGGSQARTCTVSNGQRVQFAPSSGDGASVNFKVTATTNVVAAGGYSVGDTVCGWALISTGTLNLCDGPWLQLTDVGSTSTVYYGYNKGGSTTGYFPSDQNFILMSTPDFTVASGNTGLKPEVVCQVNATGAGGLADVTVHSMGIINSTRSKAISTTDLRGILFPNTDPVAPVAIFDGDHSLGDWVAPVATYNFAGSDTTAMVKNGFAWVNTSRTINTPAGQSEQGLRFLYPAEPNPSSSGTTDEQRFAFTPMSEMYIKRRIFIPANYQHRKSISLAITGSIAAWQVGDTVRGADSVSVGTISYISGQDVFLLFPENQVDGAVWTGTVTNTTRSSSLAAVRTGYAENNKFMAIWCDGYSGAGQSPTVVFQMRNDYVLGGSVTQGGTTIYANCAVDGLGTGQAANTGDSPDVSFITPTDFGTWIDVVIYLKMATNEATNNGIIRLWKKAQGAGSYTKLIEQTDRNIGARAAATPTLCTFKAGYIWGWANSGYAATTQFNESLFEVSATNTYGVI